MRISDLIEKYDFHDSGVETFFFSPEKKEIVMDIDFCNWRQLSYKAGVPEIIMGRLIFTNVFFYKIDADSPLSDDDEILSATVLPSADKNEEILEMCLLSTPSQGNVHEAKILQIGAKDVTLSLTPEA